MFVLCYKGIKKDGKKDILPIYEDKLENIDMYTSYKLCDSKESLFKLLPVQVKEFILKNFIENEYGNLNGDFFVRKTCKNIRKGRTNLDIIYSMDSDIIYSYQKDIYNAFCKVKIDIDNYDSNDFNIILQRKFFAELYSILKDEKRLMHLLDQNNERINTYASNKSRICSIATINSNLNLIATYMVYNYKIRRDVLMLFKKYFSKEIKIISNEKIGNREEKRKFSLSNAIKNMNKNLSNEKMNFEKEEKEESYSSSFIHEDDFEYNPDNTDINYEDEDKDDFLGPKKPNDPKYWSIK